MFDWLGDLISDTLVSLFATMVSVVGQAFASVVIWTLQVMFDITDPQIDAPWVVTWASRVFAISLPVIIIFMAVQVSIASFQARSSAGIGVALGGAVKAVIGTMISLPILNVLVSGVDAIANGFLELIDADIKEFTTTMGNLADLDQTERGRALTESVADAGESAMMFSAPVLLLLLLVLFVVGLLASLFLGIVLTVRTQLLYIAVAVLPLAFAGLASEPTRGWPKKILAFIGALTVAKLGIVVVIGIGMSAIVGIYQSEEWSQVIGAVMTSVTMVIIATFVPKLAFNLFDFIGGEGQVAASGAGGLAAGSVGGAAKQGGAMLRGAVAKGAALLTGGTGAAVGAAAGAAGAAAGAAGAATGAAGSGVGTAAGAASAAAEAASATGGTGSGTGGSSGGHPSGSGGAGATTGTVPSAAGSGTSAGPGGSSSTAPAPQRTSLQTTGSGTSEGSGASRTAAGGGSQAAAPLPSPQGRRRAPSTSVAASISGAAAVAEASRTSPPAPPPPAAPAPAPSPAPLPSTAILNGEPVQVPVSTIAVGGGR